MNITQEDLDATRRVIDFIHSNEWDIIARQVQKDVHSELERRGLIIGNRDPAQGASVKEYRLSAYEEANVSHGEGEVYIDGHTLVDQVLFGDRDAYVAERVEHQANRAKELDRARRDRAQKKIAEYRELYPEMFDPS